METPAYFSVNIFDSLTLSMGKMNHAPGLMELFLRIQKQGTSYGFSMDGFNILKVMQRFRISGQAKKGTTHFIRIASAYVIWRQVRLTLALRYVLPDENALDILKILLKRLQELGFGQIRVLYLDKGFASTKIIDYLKERKQPTIIACPIRCKDGGTRALCQGRKSYRTQHTFTDGTPATLALKATLVPD